MLILVNLVLIIRLGILKDISSHFSNVVIRDKPKQCCIMHSSDAQYMYTKAHFRDPPTIGSSLKCLLRAWLTVSQYLSLSSSLLSGPAYSHQLSRCHSRTRSCDLRVLVMVLLHSLLSTRRKKYIYIYIIAIVYVAIPLLKLLWDKNRTYDNIKFGYSKTVSCTSNITWLQLNK